jgi:hypothetical protein
MGVRSGRLRAELHQAGWRERRGPVRVVGDGLIANTDVAGRKAGPCIVIVQVQHGKWVRIDPVKQGTYDCTEPNSVTTLSLDPIKAYKPS